MPLATEPIGSIPRSKDLLAAMNAYATGGGSREQLHASEDTAPRDMIALFERTGSPIITDGEQTPFYYGIHAVNFLRAGVSDPINPRWETPEEIRDRVLEGAQIIPVESLGTTDDCGFSPFADDTSTTCDTAFAKVKSRVEGTLMAIQHP